MSGVETRATRMPATAAPMLAATLRTRGRIADKPTGAGPGLRSGGDQDLVAEFRAVPEAARRLGRGMEQDLRIPAVTLAATSPGRDDRCPPN